MVCRTARRLLERSICVHEIDTCRLDEFLNGVEELLVERRRKAGDAYSIPYTDRSAASKMMGLYRF